MEIPRFTAQLRPVSTPQLRNYQAEQTEQFFGQISNNLNRAINASFNAYEQGKIEEAKQQAYADVAEGNVDFNNLEEGNTRRKRAYNEHAILAYEIGQQEVFSTGMTEIENKHRNDPQGLREAQLGFIGEMTKDLPDYIRTPMQKNYMITANADYSRTANRVAREQDDANKEFVRYNISNQASKIANVMFNPSATEEEKLELQRKSAQLYIDTENAIKSGVMTADEAMTMRSKFETDVATSYLTNIGRGIESTDEAVKFNSAFINGKTGMAIIDEMPYDKRQNILIQTNNEEAQINSFQELKDKEILQQEVNVYNEKRFAYLRDKDEIPVEMRREVEQNLLDTAPDYDTWLETKKALTKQSVTTSSTALRSLVADQYSGNLNQQTINTYYDEGILSDADYKSYSKMAASPVQNNKKTDSYKTYFAPFAKPKSQDIFAMILSGESDDVSQLSVGDQARLQAQREMDMYLQEARSAEEIKVEGEKILKKYNLFVPYNEEKQQKAEVISDTDTNSLYKYDNPSQKEKSHKQPKIPNMEVSDQEKTNNYLSWLRANPNATEAEKKAKAEEIIGG